MWGEGATSAFSGDVTSFFGDFTGQVLAKNLRIQSVANELYWVGLSLTLRVLQVDRITGHNNYKIDLVMLLH